MMNNMLKQKGGDIEGDYSDGMSNGGEDDGSKDSSYVCH